MLGQQDDQPAASAGGDSTPATEAATAPATVISPDPEPAIETHEDSHPTEATAPDSVDSGPTKDDIVDVFSPAGGYPKAPTLNVSPSAPSAPAIDNPAPSSAPPVDDDLDSIKKHALDELAPLVDKLDLPPLERFKTIMMIIQASDNQSLLEAAYESAHAIEDETEKAQALLDIVNEVNYFTQPPAAEA